MPEHRDVNLNERVVVDLTPFGKRIYLEFYDRLSLPEKYRVKPSDADKSIEIPLWNLMEIFGPHLHMGMPEVPFNNNTIRFTGDF